MQMISAEKLDLIRKFENWKFRIVQIDEKMYVYMKSRPAANQVPAHCSNNRDEKAGRKFNNEKKSNESNF